MLEAKDQGHKRKCSPKKKKGLHKNFSSDLQKKTFSEKIFQALHNILTIQKIVLSSSRGQANFRGLEAKAKDLTFEAKDFKMCPRGQGRPRGLHLCKLLYKFRWTNAVLCFTANVTLLLWLNDEFAVFGLLVAYGVDSGAVMATLVFMTIRML